MLAKLKAALKAIPRLIGLRDVICFGGLGCIGYGIGQVSEPAAWCVVGFLLFWLSIRRVNGPS